MLRVRPPTAKQTAEKLYHGRKVQPRRLKPRSKQCTYRRAKTLRHPKSGAKPSFSAACKTRTRQNPTDFGAILRLAPMDEGVRAPITDWHRTDGRCDQATPVSSSGEPVSPRDGGGGGGIVVPVAVGAGGTLLMIGPFNGKVCGGGRFSGPPHPGLGFGVLSATRPSDSSPSPASGS